MSDHYQQCCASSTGGVGDVGLCCTDLGPETWEAASSDRCNSDEGRQSPIGYSQGTATKGCTCILAEASPRSTRSPAMTTRYVQ